MFKTDYGVGVGKNGPKSDQYVICERPLSSDTDKHVIGCSSITAANNKINHLPTDSGVW